MKIFIVTVRTPRDGRYIDSLWVSHQNAVDRVKDLIEEFRRCGLSPKNESSSWWAWWSEATATDGRLEKE